jgi:hypothetical protein
MDCQTTEMPDETTRLEWLRRLVGLPLEVLRSRRPKLDLEVMSDYMKRDLGFLDGRDPRQESDLSR